VERFSALFDDPARDAWQRPEEVVRLLSLAPGDSVADLGAGTGYFLPYLSRAVGPSGSVWALDVESAMVEHVRQRARAEGLDNVRALRVAPDDPGLPEASLARILIVDTWHHIDDRVAYATRLARALRPGGEIWVVDFTLESDIGPPPAHRLSAEQVRSELEGAGLRTSIAEGQPLPKQYLVRAWLDAGAPAPK
jgi:ubiquinone/menaquinone biosynthesis C-methylase UbiE